VHTQLSSFGSRLPSLAAAVWFFATLTQPVLAADDPAPETLVVTATRSAQPELDTVGNIARLSEADIDVTAAVHPYELGVRVPGVWIGRGSGQEHLTAIRSPVLTGAGSCGSFLIMEDGIPTRPAGFCNVNQMFEVPSEMARSVEVIRGPKWVAWHRQHPATRGRHPQRHTNQPDGRP